MISITHRSLSTQITALKIKDNIIFIGEGQHVYIYTINGERVDGVQVFRAAVVHGIKVQVYPTIQGPWWILAVFGQKSLSILGFCPLESKCYVLLEEVCFVDWIIDAAWEKDLLHLVVALAHNTLLRYELPVRVQINLKMKGSSSSKKKKNLLDFSQETDFSQKKCIENLDCINRNIVQKTECAEKSVLFSGCIVMMSGSWESAVLLAGTVAQEVLVWGPSGKMDDNSRIFPYHRLTGHQGSIFSVTYCPDQRIIATTSDDRSVRVWEVTQAGLHMESEPTKAGNPTDPSHDKYYWRDSKIVERFKSYGHSARVWKSLILPTCIISVGEDSNVCIWNHDGTLAISWKAHDGSSIWSVAATECADQVITGAGDGSVRAWCLKCKDPLLAHPLADLPNNSKSDGCEKAFNVSSSSKFINKESEKVNNVEYNENESEVATAQLFNESEGKSPERSKEKRSKPDFPRCASLVGVRQAIVVMDSGRLYSWHQQSSSWQLQYKDERLKNYALLQVSQNFENAALATLYGDVIILCHEKEMLKVLVDVKVSEGKIFSLLWLGVDQILVCGGAGVITTWQVWGEAGKLRKRQTHILPPSKQRWVSGACLYPGDLSSAITTAYLVCGDRSGSLHLYDPQVGEPVHSLHGIHGRSGVTSVVVQGWRVFSSGRDGCVRSLTVKAARLQVTTVTRVSGVSWVARLIFTLGRTLAVCFHDVKMKVWSVEEERNLLEVECGGGHRSWDLHILEKHDELVCLFLKDAKAYTLTTSMKDKLLPVIKTPVNSQETLSLQVLFCHGEEVVFATGGEDTTLRLHSIKGCESHQPLGVIHSHISNIRALCIIDGRGKSWEKTAANEGTLWMVSAGGRAQIKIWKSTFVSLSDEKKCLQNQPNSRFMFPGTSEEIPKGIPNKLINKKSREESNMKEYIYKPAQTTDSTNIICQEVASHMLRTGSHKTWKSQELTFDPETRYMDTTAFWVTESRAFVLLASSDGFLRIFQFCALTETVKLVCTEEWDCCILKVARLQVAGRVILVSATTRGSVIFWDVQGVIDWMKQYGADEVPPSPPRLYHLARVSVHQSGVNSLAFTSLTESMAHPVTRHSTTMATGGDDNKLGVWQVMVETREDGRLKVAITALCQPLGHASQITGLHWLSSNLLVSTSIDQRLVLWKLHYQEGKECRGQTYAKTKKGVCVCDERLVPLPVIECVSSCFTGVPDVKGLAVVDCSESSQLSVYEDYQRDGDIKKQILVYGMGLQVFEVSLKTGNL